MRLIDEATIQKIKKEAPEFIEAIEQVQRDNIDTLLFMLDAFAGDPELLYAVLWLAYSKGVGVTLVPKQPKS